MEVEEWLGKENQLGIDIWHKKYQADGETFDEWIDRVSGGDQDVAEMILDKKFLFGGRILANRGRKGDRRVCTSNCFVLPVEDSIESIFDCAKQMARTYSTGGGVGVDLSKLAPKGAKIRNAANSTTGSVSFMDLYSMVTGLIGASGRRSALMLSMSCDHPDIEEFIDVKNDLDKVTYANISVRATNMFMEAAEKDADFMLKFERPETGEVIEKKVKARDLLHKLAENNWKTGEPGMLFWDRIDQYNMMEKVPDFKYAGVNPCRQLCRA